MTLFTESKLYTVSTLARQFFRDGKKTEDLLEFCIQKLSLDLPQQQKLLSAIIKIRSDKPFEAMSDLLSLYGIENGVVEDWIGKAFEKMDKSTIAEEYELKSALNIPYGRFALVRFCSRHFKRGEPWLNDVMINTVIPHLNYDLNEKDNLQVEKSAFSRLASFAAWYCFRTGDIYNIEKFIEIAKGNLDGDSRSLIGLADVLIRIDKIDEALPLLEKISNDDPLELERLSESSLDRIDSALSEKQDFSSRRIVGLVLYYRKEYESAIPHLQYVYRLEKSPHKTGLVLAKSLLEIKSDEAEDVLLTLAEEKQLDVDLTIALLDFHYKSRNTSASEMVKIVEDFLRLYPNEHRIIIKAIPLYTDGIKDAELLSEHLEECLKYPNFPEDMLKTIIQNNYMGLSSMALEYGFNNYPNSQYFYIQKAIYIRKDDREEAIRLFQKGLEVQPGDNEGRYYYILFLFEIEEFDQVLNSGLPLLDSKQPNLNYIMVLLNAAVKIKEELVLIKLIKAINNISNFELDKIDMNTLKDMYFIAVQKKSTDILIFIAKVYLSKNQYQKALLTLDRCQVFNPKDLDTQKMRLFSALKIGDNKSIHETIDYMTNHELLDLNVIIAISEFYNKQNCWEDSLSLLRVHQKKYPDLLYIELNILYTLHRVSEVEHRINDIRSSLDDSGDKVDEMKSIIEFFSKKLQVQRYPDDDVVLWDYFHKNEFYIKSFLALLRGEIEDILHFAVLIKNSDADNNTPKLIIMYEATFKQTQNEDGKTVFEETEDSKNRINRFNSGAPQFNVVFISRQEMWQNFEDQNRGMLENIYTGILVWDKMLGLSLKILNHHLKKSLTRFEKYVVCFALSGSSARGVYSYNSDIDFWIVIDDTDLKRMGRKELYEKIVPIIKELFVQSAAHYGVDKKGARLTLSDFHIQVHLLTELWSYFSKGDPIISTFVQDGVPLFDRNIFSVWKRMWQNKLLFPQKFTIDEMKMDGVEAKNQFEKNLFSSLEQDIYQRVKKLLRAALNKVEIISPSPSNLPSSLKRAFVDENSSITNTKFLPLKGYLSIEIIESVDRLLRNFKKIEHREIRIIDGTLLDQFRIDLTLINDAFSKLLDKIDTIEANDQ